MFLQDRTLRRIFLVVLVLALLTPFATERLLFPAVRRLQIRNAERESLGVARHLVQTMGEEHEGEDEEKLLRDETKQLRKVFDLMAIQYYDPTGRLRFSTHTQHRHPPGRVHPRVASILASGVPDSHFVPSEEATYEGTRFRRDVVETYVPVVIRGEKRGVIEIYYDIQARRADLEESLHRASGLSWMISVLVLLVAAVVLQRADTEGRRRRKAEQDLKDLNARLEDLVRERTAELSETNRALEESRERFRKLATCAVDAIIVCDDRGRVSFWNESAARIFGYTEAEMIGSDLHDRLMPARYRDDYDEGLRGFRISGKGPFLDRTTEIIALCRDGRELPVEISLTAVDLDGKLHTIGIVRDVSDRKKVQQALWETTSRFKRLFQDAAEAGMIVRGATLEVLDVNKAALRLFDVGREKALWAGIWDRFAPERREEIRRAVSSLDTGRPAFRIDDAEISLGDDEALVIVRGHLISGEDDLVYCGFTDVTERTRMAWDFEAALKRLVQGEKMAFLGTMISGFAHDLNNPNQLVAMGLPLLERIWRDALPVLEAHAAGRPDFRPAGLPLEELKTQVPGVLADMRSGSERIAALIDNLLDYAREEQRGNEEYFDVNGVVEAALGLLKPKIKALTNALVTDLGKDIPPLYGRRQQIEQVVVNLVRNALEALPSPENGVNVATRFDADTGRVVLSVRDQGLGMSPDVLRKATKAFFTTRHGQGGTGLGLALCDLFVRAHGGTLDLVSRPGEGTLAEVRLPARSPEEDRPDRG